MKVYELIARLMDAPAGADILVTLPSGNSVPVDEEETSSGGDVAAADDCFSIVAEKE